MFGVFKPRRSLLLVLTETPFRAGRAKDPKQEEYMSSAMSPEELGKQESIASVKKEKTKKPKKKVKRAENFSLLRLFYFAATVSYFKQSTLHLAADDM